MNTNYEILTSEGFSDFDGVRKKLSKNGIVLKLSNGGEFKCTREHLILVGGEYVEAEKLLGVEVNGLLVVDLELVDDEIYYYDVLETNNHNYITSEFTSHNCEFEGSLATLVHASFVKGLKDKYMQEPLNVLDDKKLRIFSWPISKKTVEENNYEYLITVDPAMGTNQDYTVAQVWLVRSNTDVEQVAIYQSNDIPPPNFVSKILALCKMYHNPFVIIETMEPAGGIILGLLMHNSNYYNVINMQKDGIGFRMSHERKIKSCTLLQVYCEKQAIKIRDENTYAEIEMFGKKHNTYQAIGDNHDDCVMSVLSMLYYINSPYFYGNIDAVSIHKKPSTVKIDGMEETDDVLIKEALARMLEEDDVKGDGSEYTGGAFIIASSSKVSFEDAARWRNERMPDQASNPMFNPNAGGNIFWHNQSGY
jgi:hypothetical protein